jgi:diguanylate cyclase (GGDEF)-like protein
MRADRPAVAIVTNLRRYTRLAFQSLVLGGVAVALVVVGYLLRQLNVVFNPALWASIQLIASFLSFSIAANVLVRFLGTGDRASLILGSGFVLGGCTELAGIIAFYSQSSDVSARAQASLSPILWMIAETLLAILLLLAFSIDEWLTWPRQPKRVVLAVVTFVLATGYLIAITFLAIPRDWAIRSSGLLPSRGELIPAAIFFAAAIALYRSRRRNLAAFDATLVWIASVNTISHFIASESARQLDVPAISAELLNTGSFVVLLGATLLDNVRLFGEVQNRATSDSLTGLANYRRLIDILQSELERSGRTNRPFSVLLMDLDGLKTINDNHGHLTGSRAICRVGEVLRLYCRTLDTAARYGGDEFALILPETDETAARQVSLRIRRHLAADSEAPRLSLSVGTATYPNSGATIQQLLDAADQDLYAAKAASKRSGWRQLPLGL